MPDSRPLVSIVCPAYNEQEGIEAAVAGLKRCLDQLGRSAEVLLIDDGSRDRTVELARRAIAGDRRFRIFSHRVNFGRGRALRTGIQEARGEIIVTTEADLSWGQEIIGRLVEALERDPGADAVFASPHLPGGGYRRVPAHRVLLSSLGNRLLRFFYARDITMVTGMTRAYRAQAVKHQNFSQDGKEFHLEVAYRLRVMGRKVIEVPAVLSWPEPKGKEGSRGKRTKWKKIFSLISSHLAFGMVSGGARIMGIVILLLSVAIVAFGIWALVLLFEGQPSIYLATLVGVLMVLWMGLTSTLLLFQRSLQHEITAWQNEMMLSRLMAKQGLSLHDERYYFEVSLD